MITSVNDYGQCFRSVCSNGEVDATADGSLFWIYFNDKRGLIIVRRQSGCGIHDSASAHDQDCDSLRRGFLRPLPDVLRQRFAEPDDVGAPPSAARVFDFVVRKTGGIERPACVTARAARFAQAAVQLEYVARAGAQMQRVHVLRGERKVVKRSF